MNDKRNSEQLITSQEGKEKFSLTAGGLLYTSEPLDREERDTYLLTVLVGRRGLPRGFRSQQAIQVKVGNVEFLIKISINIFSIKDGPGTSHKMERKQIKTQHG